MNQLYSRAIVVLTAVGLFLLIGGVFGYALARALVQSLEM